MEDVQKGETKMIHDWKSYYEDQYDEHSRIFIACRQCDIEMTEDNTDEDCPKLTDAENRK
jgi:hypothetical protein